jgi:hypothetical protein
MNHVAIPADQVDLTVMYLRLLLVPSGDPQMTTLAEICDTVNSLALMFLLMLRHSWVAKPLGLRPYGAISAPSRNQVSQLC